MADALQPALTAIGLAFGRLSLLHTPLDGQAFFRDLGFAVPSGAFGPALNALATSAGGLSVEIDTLAVADGGLAVATAEAALMVKLANFVGAIDDLDDELQAAGIVIADLPRRLCDFLVLEYLSRSKPDIHELLQLLGIIEHEPIPTVGHPTRQLHWGRLSQLLKAPRQVFTDVYGWEANFDLGKVITRLSGAMRALNLPGGRYPPSATVQAALGSDASALELRLPLLQNGFTPATYRQFGITVSAAPGRPGVKAGLAILPYVLGPGTADFKVCERGELTYDASGDIRGVGFVLRPPANASGTLNLTGAFDASFRLRQATAFAKEIVLFGTGGGSRLSLQGLGMRTFVAGTRDNLDLGVEADVEALRFVLALDGDADGFLQKMLSGVRVQAQSAIGLAFTVQNGFKFRGGGQLALELGTHLNVGPVRVDGLRLVVEPAADAFVLQTGAILRFDLGPMKAVVENVGVQAALRFQPGVLGFADLGIEFMPPDGVGLSLDAGGFKGGGFLRLDHERGEYAGALELDFHGLFSVKAVAVINTKRPDGQPGFSLVILIVSEFTPIQLSFGFTLNGVGGLLGLNRTINLNALVEGIRTNAIESILFPKDVVANAARIISDIKQFFPPEDDHFVVGPMAKLGWGTPSIITVEIGLLLDLPEPMFALVGVLRAGLPTADTPLLRLQANFIGIADFDAGYFFFRADLYESRLLVYTITGSMAVLVSWGDRQTFALSVGGFHPDFRDVPAIPALPDGFKNMARIGISLLSEDNPRLKVESYFAVTSNTVQFGARVELYAAAAGFNVYGFLGFDVLFQFDPFRFLAELYGGIALREGSDVIAGINITARLAGPTPWDARGTATLTILFIDIDIDFHVTWGDPPRAVASDTEDLLALLKRELADTRNWSAKLPPQNHLHVSLRSIDDEEVGADVLVIHPAGVVTFNQRSLPLDGYLIDKHGTRKPLDARQFTLSNATAGTQAVNADFKSVREPFAVGEFTNLSDSEKLSRPSYAEFPSGFTLSGTAAVAAGKPVTRDVIYELSYLHGKRIQRGRKFLVGLAVRTYDLLVKACAVRQSALAHQQLRVSVNAPPAPLIQPDRYAVASTADLSAHVSSGQVAAPMFASEAQAYQHMSALTHADPSLAGQLQVVSQFELAH